MRWTSRQSETRTPSQLREHYEIEKELANRLREAAPSDRRCLYGALYDELYDRVPHHPLHRRRSSSELNRALVTAQLKLLQPFLRHDVTFLEVGAGDCGLSLAVARRVRQVYALDVSARMTGDDTHPANFRFILSDGTNVPIPSASVDVAYSNQVMEHVHPDDARDHLAAIHLALRPGGVYVCLTPSRLSGPHDISRYFDAVATGFHLKEYTVGELSRALRAVGFRRIQAILGTGAWLIRSPVGPSVMVETVLGVLPRGVRRLAAMAPLCRTVLGVRLAATK